MRAKKYRCFLFLLVLSMISLACNFPGYGASSNNSIATEPVTVDEPSDTTQNPGNDTPSTPPPASEILPSPGLPTLELAGGSGWIFSTAQPAGLGEGDYDIWWNNAQIVALTNHSFVVSLGVVGNLSDVSEINTQDMASGALVPSPGEGFAFKIEKGEGFEYALVRMLGLKEPNLIVLEYLYPYQGQVIENP